MPKFSSVIPLITLYELLTWFTFPNFILPIFSKTSNMNFLYKSCSPWCVYIERQFKNTNNLSLYYCWLSSQAIIKCDKILHSLYELFFLYKQLLDLWLTELLPIIHKLIGNFIYSLQYLLLSKIQLNIEKCYLMSNGLDKFFRYLIKIFFTAKLLQFWKLFYFIEYIYQILNSNLSHL